jgi:type II restriction enzyme
LTTFGSSIFEPVAAALAKTKFTKVETQFFVGDAIFSDCQQSVRAIINELTISPKPDKIKELELLKKSLSGATNKLKPAKVDLFVETKEGEQRRLSKIQTNFARMGRNCLHKK